MGGLLPRVLPMFTAFLSCHMEGHTPVDQEHTYHTIGIKTVGKNNVKCAVHQTQCIMYRVQCAEYNLQNTMYRIQCTGYKVESTEDNVQRTMYRVQCTEYNVKSIMYTVQCKK